MKHYKIPLCILFACLTTTVIINAFSAAVDFLSLLFLSHPIIVWTLPLAGAGVLLLYKLLKVPFSISTKHVVSCAQKGKDVPASLIPAIFIGTCATIAAGGSVGKEAAALQIGTSVASAISRKTSINLKSSISLMMQCCMASALSVLLGTPIGAALFSIELVNYKLKSPRSAIMIFVSSFLSFIFCKTMGADYFSATFPNMKPNTTIIAFFSVLSIAIIAIGCIYCYALTYGRDLVDRIPIHPIVKFLVGGTALAIIIYFGNGSAFSGTGITQLQDALNGNVDSLYYLGKMLLTVLVLSIGFKGGEIMPMLCIGATLGCDMATTMGINPTFGAVLGFVGLISVTTNCPLAAIAIACESFGVWGIGWYCATSALAFLCTLGVSLFRNIELWEKIRLHIESRADS